LTGAYPLCGVVSLASAAGVAVSARSCASPRSASATEAPLAATPATNVRLFIVRLLYRASGECQLDIAWPAARIGSQMHRRDGGQQDFLVAGQQRRLSGLDPVHAHA